MNISAAPLQGYTEAPFRHSHAEIYGKEGAADTYYTPFVRIEHGEPRKKDLNDTGSALNANHHIIPQIIARDDNEFRCISDNLIRQGHKEIDLNMGCPFPPQNQKGRGAALITHQEALAAIADVMKKINRDGVTISIKMRLGMELPNEWENIIDIINEMPLSHVTIHPRVARQQYRGELHLNQLQAFVEKLDHKWIYNGEIHSPQDIENIHIDFPSITGIMIGRGLLERPSIIAEWRQNREWSREERIKHLLKLHDNIYEHYAQNLCGESQILSKIKSFWDYSESEIGHKEYKTIKKSTTLNKYIAAVNSIKLS